MSESLRDQLLKSGLAHALKPEPRPRPAKPQRPIAKRERDRAEIDLAKAYALRDTTERAERERVQREAEQRSREKRERRQRLMALLDGKALNAKDADIPRHFPHANKIRRVYVTADQLPRLNGGDLGVVQLAGRYLLVASDIAKAACEIDADALVLLCDSVEQGAEDDVPSDLIW
ncbi:MAG TPA: DUF2058 family protein [Rhodanobacteraceae bacterium]|jgi:uncharacterized protein YaiL (DUF2058 family)|nr:DUF2058 family protein [Rhodanobacteraceae bacterium]